MKYSILATEGPHDQAFLAKLLQTLGLERIKDDRDSLAVVYPDHRDGAERFLDGLKSQHTNHLKTFTREKAVVACIVGVLKPGRTNTASIADNDWISEQTVTNVAEVSSLHNFIKTLLEIA